MPDDRATPQRGDAPKIDARFLLERELAGEPRAALMAVYPRRLWPPEWTTDNDLEQVQDHEEKHDDPDRT